MGREAKMLLQSIILGTIVVGGMSLLIRIFALKEK